MDAIPVIMSKIQQNGVSITQDSIFKYPIPASFVLDVLDVLLYFKPFLFFNQ